MPKFCKKPVVVEAEQWHPGLEDGWEYEDNLPYLTDRMYAASKVDLVRLYPYIDWLMGRHYIGAGDWIITHANSNREPCHPAIFATMYKAV